MSTPDDSASSPPSLLSAESRGGDTNEGGLDFQMAVLMTYLPRWLGMEGFTMLIREASGDFEALFFAPGHGYVREFLEAKDHLVTPAKFWAEIEHFQKFDRKAKNEFHWFTLVSAGLSTELHPLTNGLRRLRDPYGFYGPDSAILEKSYDDYVSIVEGMGRSAEDASFLFTKVKIEPDWAPARASAAAQFRDALLREIPDFRDVPGRIVDDAYSALTTIVRGSRNKPIRRDEMEEALRKFLGTDNKTVHPPLRIHTAMDATREAPAQELALPWSKFFGGEGRIFPPPTEWNDELVAELRGTKQWALEHRATRRIRLSGNRRLSASVAFGFVFSAVAGYAIDVVARDGAVWSTGDHQIPGTPTYVLNQSQLPSSEGRADLVVSIGVMRDIATEVSSSLARHGLETAYVLHLSGAEPIQSAQQANALVADLKKHISAAIRDSEAVIVHLFIAAPAFLAVLLGHRLNASAPVQCYEWVSSGNYVPTCRLA